MPLAKLYTNSLLSTLNSRRRESGPSGVKLSSNQNSGLGRLGPGRKDDPVDIDLPTRAQRHAVRNPFHAEVQPAHVPCAVESRHGHRVARARRRRHRHQGLHQRRGGARRCLSLSSHCRLHLVSLPIAICPLTALPDHLPHFLDLVHPPLAFFSMFCILFCRIDIRFEL
jgi:hypothetical protein